MTTQNDAGGSPALSSRAPMRAFGPFGFGGVRYQPDGGGDGAGQGSPPATPPADPAAKNPPPAKKPGEPAPANDPPRLTLTEAELQARIDAALKKREDEQAAARQREKEEADRKAAEEQGRWKELADAEAKKRAASDAEAARLKTELRRSEVKDQIRADLKARHPDYAGSRAEEWIIRAVQFEHDTPQEEITKRVKAQVDAYVNDNKPARTTPPPPPPGGPHGGGGTQQSGKRGGEANDKPRQFTGVAAGW